MKINQTVTLVGATGMPTVATVHAIVGAGESGYKILDLAAGAEIARDVPHARDLVAGAPYWTLDDVPIPTPALDITWHSNPALDEEAA